MVEKCCATTAATFDTFMVKHVGNFKRFLMQTALWEAKFLGYISFSPLNRPERTLPGGGGGGGGWSLVVLEGHGGDGRCSVGFFLFFFTSLCSWP